MPRATLPLTAVLLWVGSIPISAGDKSKAPPPKSAPLIATLECLKKGWVQLMHRRLQASRPAGTDCGPSSVQGSAGRACL
jgi:hypothetical protein